MAPDIESARNHAQINLEMLNRLIPAKLQFRENHLYKTIFKGKSSAVSKLHDLYGFMEELFVYVSKITPCKQGCSYCCHIPVSVSALELEYMKTRGKNFLAQIGPSPSDSNNACPFLSNETCSIYEIRPFFCRRHVTLTATSFWCHPDRCHSSTLPLLSFSRLFPTSARLRKEQADLRYKRD